MFRVGDEWVEVTVGVGTEGEEEEEVEGELQGSSEGRIATE